MTDPEAADLLLGLAEDHDRAAAAQDERRGMAERAVAAARFATDASFGQQAVEAATAAAAQFQQRADACRLGARALGTGQ